MKKIFVFVVLVGLSFHVNSQTIDFENDKNFGGLYTKLYAEIDYNQPIIPGQRTNGKMDVHRLVALFGYQFNDRTQFVSEIEVEHSNEVFIEQGYLKHQFSQAFNLKTGILLIPMGMINENHEPTTFYSVERPLLDNVIIPTTWREIGIGLNGIFIDQSIKYQAYLVNGFLSYKDGGLLKGSNGLRSGRQKGIKSVFSGSPNISTQFEYFGIPDLKLALSWYYGNTQSSMFDGIADDDDLAMSQADSTVVGVNMIGFHTTYDIGDLEIRGQFIYNKMSNVAAYNAFTGRDLGSDMLGYYIEAGYSLIQDKTSIHDLSVFARYSNVNTHFKTTNSIEENPAYKRNIVTFGVNWKPANGAVLKADYQFFNSDAEDDNYRQFNMGVGVWF